MPDRRAAQIVFDASLRVRESDAEAMSLSGGRALAGTHLRDLLPHLVGGDIDFLPTLDRVPVSHCRQFLTARGLSAWLFHFDGDGQGFVCHFEPLERSVGFAQEADTPIFVTAFRDRVVYTNRALADRLPRGRDVTASIRLEEIADFFGMDARIAAHMAHRAGGGETLSHEVEGCGGPTIIQSAPLRYFGRVCATLWSVHESAGSRAHDREALTALAARLAAMYQHEMRNPLQAVQAAIAIMRRRDGDGTYGAMLDVMERNVATLSEILSDRLVPPETHGPKESVLLSAVVSRAIADAKVRQSSHLLSFVHEIPPGEPPIRCHGPGMTRVFANLFRNTAQVRPDAEVRISYRTDGAGLWCVVEDNGPGFPPDVLGGTGPPADPTRHFGLVLVTATVEGNGGRVVLENATAGGARVALWLPLAAPAGAHQTGGVLAV